MRYRVLGSTGLNVSVIGYGAIKLPEIAQAQATGALNRALDLGVNFIDTARGYKDSETKIGVALKGRRKEYYIATKTPSRDYAGAMADIEKSLNELQCDSVDLLQLHSVSDEDAYAQVTAPGGALEALHNAKDSGKVAHIGITIHRSVSVMRQAILSGEFETLMVVFNPMDEEGVEKEILPMAREAGMGVIAMKALSGGKLATPMSDGQRTASDFDPIVRGALWYVASNNNVSTVIPGMRSVGEIEQNVKVGDYAEPMSDGARNELIRRIGKLGLSFRLGQHCLRCGYCLPCSVGIQIPEVFRAHDIYSAYPDSLKPDGLGIFTSLDVSPEECTECGDCVPRCPAGIAIPEKLKEAVKTLNEAVAKAL